MEITAESFLSQYDANVFEYAMLVRELLFANLPGIIEQVDVPAKMVAYSYGRKYAELICIILPSKKGLKLGFNRGIDLYDPAGLLEGAANISRYVVIRNKEMIVSAALKDLIATALAAYKERIL